ncbi:MAG: hypothetical protein MUC36_19205 [Planctomycetes bacterium]|nr:hypothetical protein [Planctomycetota bacterium]
MTASLMTLPLLAQPPAPTQVTVAEYFGSSRLCYDESRQRLLVVGIAGSLWEHDGNGWAERQVPGVGAAGHIVYDPSRERVVFVNNSAGMFEYDGAAMRQIGTAPTLLRVVADSTRGRLVGVRPTPIVAPQGTLIEEFDGTAWTTVATIPLPGVPITAIFDRSRGRTIVQTIVTSPSIGRELWEWDGTNLVGPLQSGHQAALLAYDPVNGGTLFSLATGVQLWNGTTFTSLGVQVPQLNVRAVTDAASGRVLFQAGDEIWSWNGSAATAAFRTPLPFMYRSMISADPQRQRIVLLGNLAPSSLLPIQREWDGFEWHTVPTSPLQPPSFVDHSQVFDAARNETLVFGGQDPATGTPFGDTYGWNGGTWRQLATSGPSPRSRAAIAYDSLRQRVVLVGGRGTQATALAADHWEWDGSGWQQITAATPMGTSLGSLGFDPIRNRLVFLSDLRLTFEWNGISWAQVASQGPRAVARNLVWNPVAGVLQAALANSAFDGSVFTWNGATWTESHPATGETAIDPVTGMTLILNINRTVVSTDVPATIASYGSGCGGTANAPSLTTFGRPVVGSQRLHLDLRADARLRPALIGLGSTAANVPLWNGCSLLFVDTLSTLVWFTDAAGFLHQRVPLPNSPSLRGQVLVAQGAVIDPASPGALALTPGLTLRLGD